MKDSQNSDEFQDTSENNAKTEENLVESSFETEFEEERVEVWILGLCIVKGLCNILRRKNVRTKNDILEAVED